MRAELNELENANILQGIFWVNSLIMNYFNYPY
jgi:hypothetical protein